jgi:hypothetical protein
MRSARDGEGDQLRVAYERAFGGPPRHPDARVASVGSLTARRLPAGTSRRRSTPARLVTGEEERLEDEARRLEHAEELRSLAQG